MDTFLKSLMLVMITSCGQQLPPAATATETGSAVETSAAKSDSIQAANGASARLVQAVTDLQCTAQNADQLIYAKDTKGFFYCDNASWVAIDVQGPAGKDGAVGKDGIAGAVGADGKAGSNGVDGKSGEDGIAGAAGADGIAGINGADGINGAAGTNGVDGQSVSMVAKYSLSPAAGANSLGGNSSVTVNYIQASVFADGSIYFSGEVIYFGTVYSPSFFLGASEKANTEMTSLTNFISGGKTLAIRTEAGANALTGYHSYATASTFTVGLQIPNTGLGADVMLMTYFTLNYEDGQ